MKAANPFRIVATDCDEYVLYEVKPDFGLRLAWDDEFEKTARNVCAALNKAYAMGHKAPAGTKEKGV